MNANSRAREAFSRRAPVQTRSDVPALVASPDPISDLFGINPQEVAYHETIEAKALEEMYRVCKRIRDAGIAVDACDGLITIIRTCDDLAVKSIQAVRNAMAGNAVLARRCASQIATACKAERVLEGRELETLARSLFAHGGVFE